MDAMVGQTRIETLGPDRIGIASYKDGRLRGGEVAYELSSSWANDWIDSRTPVDHPELPHWQVQLRRMQQAAEARDADPEPLLREASGFPFSQGRHDCLSQWVGDEPERAAQLLDRYDLLDAGKTSAEKLAVLAVKEPQGDDRLARWTEAMAEENHRAAAMVVVKSHQAGPRTAAAALRRLGSFSSSSRRELFLTVAPQVVGDYHNARLIVDAVDELSSSEEAAAMLPLLRLPEAGSELGLRVLRAIGDFRSPDRADLFAECARLVSEDARGADALVAALNSLRSNDRIGAVRRVFELPANENVMVGLLRATGDLPSRDRARLIEAAMQQPLWNAAIERAALHAVGEVSRRSDRERIRDAVHQHSRQQDT